MPSFNVLNGILWNKKQQMNNVAKVKVNGNSCKKQQPIKLQIELPFEQFYQNHSSELSSDDYNELTMNSGRTTRQSSNVNHISLHISFDSNSFASKTPKLNFIEHTTSSTARKVNKSNSIKKKPSMNCNSSSTSGYSSSMTDDLIETAPNRQLFFSKTPKETHIRQEEHIYDKLSYTKTAIIAKEQTPTNKRRHSISSSSLSSSSTSSTSYYQLAGNTHNNKKAQDTNNDYEEICNFTQVTSTPTTRIKQQQQQQQQQHQQQHHQTIDQSYMYETLYNCKSSSIKRIRKINHSTLNNEDSLLLSNEAAASASKYKREYSVNEIFQNLELFKKQAKEEECILKTHFQRQQAPAAKKFNNKAPQHTYVNDRISKVV